MKVKSDIRSLSFFLFLTDFVKRETFLQAFMAIKVARFQKMFSKAMHCTTKKIFVISYHKETSSQVCPYEVFESQKGGTQLSVKKQRQVNFCTVRKRSLESSLEPWRELQKKLAVKVKIFRLLYMRFDYIYTDKLEMKFLLIRNDEYLFFDSIHGFQKHFWNRATLIERCYKSL